MKIADILTPEEIEIVKEHAKANAPYNMARGLFSRLDRSESAIFAEYYKKLKEDIAIELGFKDEPYYDSEDVDEIYPQYLWKEVPFNEKAWYRNREKNNYKK